MRHSDFAELAAFAAIVEEGSFRGAAARLGLRPSTVSRPSMPIVTFRPAASG